ncbi:DNA polymerase III, partial [Candidatus Uhrbacteria bacterium]|nr:DNA polymerase III [Candidatus Uhrbacteria bacterium]MBD3284166.1 DNA polymerase III [Candidatus Uhrbacteria bacterium]
MKRSTHTHSELAKILFEIGYYEAMQDSPFKPRAYELASEALVAMGTEIKETWKKGGVKELKKLPGIGQAIAEKIDEYYRTGTVKSYQSLKKKFPVDIWGLASIEGIGPKTIKDLYDHLKVRTLKDLERVGKQKKIQKLPGYGMKSEEQMMRGLKMMRQSTGRHLLADILPIADRIVGKLKKVTGVKRCTYAGSLRRMKETIGDIDLLITTTEPKRAVEAFTSLPEVKSVHEAGRTRASVRLQIGIDADLRVVTDEVYGAALQYFTGDKRHNVLLRQHALSKGYTLSEYGLFKRSKRGSTNRSKPIVCKTEEVIYTKLGMSTPPPEIRTGDEEIERAKTKKLPP